MHLPACCQLTVNQTGGDHWSLASNITSVLLLLLLL
jgi:hypothetical protein